MRRLAAIAVGVLGVFLAGCGSGGQSDGDTTTYTYRTESMEPAIDFEEEVTADLAAYEKADPRFGDVVVFHPPLGADLAECGVRRPAAQACPEPGHGISTQTFIKRVVGLPGDEVSFRDGLPIVNGKAMLTAVIRTCTEEAIVNELCDLPKPVKVAPGHYFVIGDNSGVSDDSRSWGSVPRAGIIGRVELG